MASMSSSNSCFARAIKSGLAADLTNALNTQGVLVYPSLAETTTGDTVRLYHAGSVLAQLIDTIIHPDQGTDFDEQVLIRLSETESVTHATRDLMPLHFPAAFPEVFTRDRPGFDCLLGNPPWESVVVAEHVWWGIHLPGIRSQPIKVMNDAIARFRVTRPDLETAFEQALENADSMRAVLRKTFPALGSGYTDLPCRARPLPPLAAAINVNVLGPRSMWRRGVVFSH